MKREEVLVGLKEAREEFAHRADYAIVPATIERETRRVAALDAAIDMLETPVAWRVTWWSIPEHVTEVEFKTEDEAKRAHESNIRCGFKHSSYTATFALPEESKK